MAIRWDCRVFDFNWWWILIDIEFLMSVIYYLIMATLLVLRNSRGCLEIDYVCCWSVCDNSFYPFYLSFHLLRSCVCQLHLLRFRCLDHGMTSYHFQIKFLTLYRSNSLSLPLLQTAQWTVQVLVSCFNLSHLIQIHQ